jgi:hypothetical protein
MSLSNLLLDTCIAIKKLQDDQDGEDIQKFLSDKKEFLSKYSIMEFKKTFVEAADHLNSMIEEGRELREIYDDIKEMITNSDLKLSRLGKRLEILLTWMNSPTKINEKVKHYLKMWRQGYLTLLFIGNMKLVESLIKCPIGDSYKGLFSEEFCKENNCEIQTVINKNNSEIKKLKKKLNMITDSSFGELKTVLNGDLNNFDKSKCRKIGDLIIAFDYLNFFNNETGSALCTTDHHFELICSELDINLINPINEMSYSSPT